MVLITDFRCLQEEGCFRRAHTSQLSDAKIHWKDLITFLLKATERKHIKYDTLNKLVFFSPHKRIQNENISGSDYRRF